MTVNLHIAIFSFSVINNNFQCQTSGWLWAWRWCKYMKNKIYHSWVLKIGCDQVKNILSDFSHLYNMATSKSQWGHKSLWKSLHYATFVTTGNCFPLLLFLSLQRLMEFLLSAIVINSNLVNFTHKCYRLQYSNVETCLFQIHIDRSHFF